MENSELTWDRVALRKWQKTASLQEGNTAHRKFLKILRKYLEQYKAENVAL